MLSVTGYFLLAFNCTAFLYVLYTSFGGLKRLWREMSNERLLWSDGRPIVLERPRYADGKHVFLSADPYVESQAIAIKSSLTTLVPSCEVFLHRDDMRDSSNLEMYVKESDVFVAIITSNYLSISSCRRELVAAVDAQKPVVLLVDSGAMRGG